MKKKPCVFGSSLAVLLEYENKKRSKKQSPICIPSIVIQLVQQIQMRRPIQGLFRENGNVTLVQNSKKAIEKRNQSWINKVGLFELGSLLKMYFRELPETIFTDWNSDTIVSVAQIGNLKEKIQVWKKILKLMPTDYLKTLEYLYYCLKWVNDEPEYEMNWKNLAICWAPSLTVHPQDSSIQIALNNSAQTTHAILVLFENFQQIISPEVDLTPSPTSVKNARVETQVKEEDKAQPRTIKIEVEPEEAIKPKPHSKIDEEITSSPTKQKSILIEPDITTPTTQPSKRFSGDHALLLSPITPHNWKENLYKSNIEDNGNTINTLRTEQNFDNFKVFVEKQLSKTKLRLQNMESYFITEFKNIWTRLDQIDELFSQKKTNVDSALLQIKNQYQDMKNDNETYLQKVDDVLKEIKYREVRMDWEMDYMKRTVESFSNRLRENALEISSIKVRVDSRIPYPMNQTVSHIDENIKIPVPNPFASNQSSTLNSPSTFSRYSKLSPTQLPKKVPEHYSIKYDKFISK